MNNKYIAIIMALISVVFFAWFIPVFITNITRTPNEQWCRLSEIMRQKQSFGVISDINIPKGSPAAVKFTLDNGTSAVYSKSDFRGLLSNIEVGDSLSKSKGSLNLVVITSTDTLTFSLENGCMNSTHE